MALVNAKEQTTMAVNPIPKGYHTATPYLIIKGASDAIEFYKKAFGATELLRMAQPDGRVGHAEVKIGDSDYAGRRVPGDGVPGTEVARRFLG